MKEKMTLEENQVFADLILKPIMTHIDMAILHGKIDPKRLRISLDDMKSCTGTLAAFPFAETMDKAETNSIENDVFEKIIELIELRTKQKETSANQLGGTLGENILIQMGLL